MSFFCSVITFSSINSNRDIKFCSNCGMSVSDTFSSDSLVSSLLSPVDKSCNVSGGTFTMVGAMKTSFTANGK